jgi:predicted nucleic acid-binding protein
VNALRGASPLVSDFAIAEFSSGVARRVRMRELTDRDANGVFMNVDAWLSSAVRRVDTTSSDIRSAQHLVRRLDLELRTPDAIHIAIAQRYQAHLLTFDRRQAKAARAVGLRVVGV